MSVEVLSNGEFACLFCNTSDWAFGPVVCLPDEAEAKDMTLEEYLYGLVDWVRENKGVDVRTLTDSALDSARFEYNAQLQAKDSEGEVDDDE